MNPEIKSVRSRSKAYLDPLEAFAAGIELSSTDGLEDFDLDELGREDDLEVTQGEPARTAALQQRPSGSKRRPGGRRNAITHGAYSQAFILPGENLEDFRQLHQSLIEDWNPDGATAEIAVLDLARCIFAKRRVERFYVEQMKLAARPPLFNEFCELKKLAEQLADAEDDFTANRIIGLLRPGYKKFIANACPRSDYSDPRSWIEALTSSIMPQIIETQRFLVFDEQENLATKTAKAARERDLTEWKIKMEERLSSQIDKLIRRITEIKVAKQFAGPKGVQMIEHRATEINR